MFHRLHLIWQRPGGRRQGLSRCTLFLLVVSGFSPARFALAISRLFIWRDGFASGLDQPPYFGYFGPDLDSRVREHLAPPQLIILGRVTFEALAQFAPSATDEISVRMNALARLVFSSTLAEPLAWKNTRLLK